jgi:hypothetical protein
LEGIAHFLLLLAPPKYAFERWSPAQQVRKNQRRGTVEALLGEPKLAIPLENYTVESMGRFRTEPSEFP